MGWANCGEDSRGRPIGYAWEATCDHPGCDKQIDRGLAYACGGMHGNEALGGDPNADWTANFPPCDRYFCGDHLRWANLGHEDGKSLDAPYMCNECASELERLYREDEEYRDLWPTDAPPLPAKAMSAGTAETQCGSGRSTPARPEGFAQKEGFHDSK